MSGETGRGDPGAAGTRKTTDVATGDDLGADWSDIAVTGGVGRDGRLPSALEDGYFRIADRDVHAQVTWLADIARHIAFAEGGSAATGSWRRLFQSDALLALCEMAACDPEEEARRFAARLASDWRDAADTLRARAAWLAAWPRRAGGDIASRAGGILDTERTETPLRARLVAIAAAGDAASVAARCTARGNGASGRTARARALRDGLRVTHGEIMTALSALRPLARSAAEARRGSGQLDPALGLLLAELRAADRVARHVDALLPGTIDFYYRDVLGQTARDADHDHVLVCIPAAARPVALPAGTGASRPVGASRARYETLDDLVAVPAIVSDQAILRYDRDPRISFSTSLGGITGIRAERLGARTAGSSDTDRPDRVERHVFDPDPARPVDMGLAIRSPMLRLAEGMRRVEVEVQLTRPSGLPAREDALDGAEMSDADLDIALRNDPDLIRALGFRRSETGVAAVAGRVRAFAAETGRPLCLPVLYEAIARRVITTRALRALLGRIVTAILIDGMPWPSGGFWRALSVRIDAAGAGLSGQRAGPDAPTPASLIAEAFRRTADDSGFAYSVEDVFEMLLGDAFDVHLTSKDGPIVPDIVRVLQSPEAHPPGFVVRLQLDPGAPPVAAPDPAEAPTLTLKLAAAARVCPQSFLEPFRLDAVRLRVRVEGLRTLAGFTDEGPVDMTQTFPAFGNRPRDGASLIVAAPEMAHKPVDRVRLAIDWADLPGRGLGFAAHYAAYGNDIALPDPTVEAAYLSADGWKPLAAAPLPLFEPQDDGTGLKAARRLSCHVEGHSVAARVADTALPRSRAALRAGAVRLTLAGSSDGFLAEWHSAALMRAMRPRRLPLAAPRQVPADPFVPRIAQFTLGYSAETVISLTTRDAARPGERITQIGPFGAAEIFPRPERRDAGLFPARLGDGARFIALDGRGALGQVSLLFEIDESGHRRVAGPRVPIAYFYLRDAGWTRLPEAAILADGTDGLMRSGVLRLDLPQDAVRGGVGMPDTGYWIAAVAVEGDLDGFPRLRSVRTNGVWLRRVAGPAPDADTPARFALDTPVAGLGAPVVVRGGRWDRDAETTRDFRARTCETLRHRGRAVTPWDFERLALEAFPDVRRAKCFAHLDRRGPAPAPGRVTVVVAPDRPDVPASAAPPPRFFDAAALRAMERHLQARAPAGARVEVANPAYEVLQVRASIAIDPRAEDGAAAQRLSAWLTRRLSFWTAPEGMDDFGWSLDPARLREEMRRDPAVREVADFAVLHLVRQDDGFHDLGDTARPGRDGRRDARLAPRLPWGLPLSAAEHVLRDTAETQPVPATPAGIGDLRVGEMLVVRPGEVA